MKKKKREKEKTFIPSFNNAVDVVIFKKLFLILI